MGELEFNRLGITHIFADPSEASKSDKFRQILARNSNRLV
jgi:hypothetical protein